MSDKTEAFLHSQTKENLMRAFAGESQARNRYTIAAGIAHKAGLAVIQGVFLFTAGQEEIHAKQFYRQLADLGGQTVRIDGTYPVDIFADLRDYLRAAQHNEYQEWEHDYQHFARTAMDEGFPLVGKLFENIANVEQTSGTASGNSRTCWKKNSCSAPRWTSNGPACTAVTSSLPPPRLLNAPSAATPKATSSAWSFPLGPERSQHRTPERSPT